MEELYAEGVAIHGGPESCVGAREGAGEALTGARVGRAIEPRNHQFGVPTLCPVAGRQHGQRRYASRWSAPRGQKNHGMHGTSKRENREIPLFARRVITGRAAQGTPMAVSLR